MIVFAILFAVASFDELGKTEFPVDVATTTCDTVDFSGVALVNSSLSKFSDLHHVSKMCDVLLVLSLAIRLNIWMFVSGIRLAIIIIV